MDHARTFSGRHLEDVLPRVREELGGDAVVLGRRDPRRAGLAGLLGGRSVELVAAAAAPVPAAIAASPGPRATEIPSAASFTDALARLEREMPAGTERAPRPLVLRRASGVTDADLTAGPASSAPAARPEPSSAPGASAARPESSAARLAPVPSPPAAAQAAEAAMVARGLSEPFARSVVEHVAAHLAPLAPDDDLRGLVVAALAARIPVFTPSVGTRGRVVAVVGAAGSGKSSLVARLALAYARGAARPVAVVALRPVDGGAALARLLAASGVALHVEADPDAAAERVGALRRVALVLVDTPGCSPRAEAQLRALAADLDALDPDERHLAVPAPIGAAAARELVAGARALGADAIAVTHLDETRQLGTVVELAVRTELPLFVLARGAELRPALAAELADELLA